MNKETDDQVSMVTKNDDTWLLYKAIIDSLLNDGVITLLVHDLMLKNVRKKLGFLTV